MKTSRQRIYLVGVGGSGAMTATRLLGEAALRAGQQVVIGEIHGMAQRGGVVESAVLIGPGHGCIVDDGEADALVAFEPIEALRALPKASPQAVVIASTHPIVPFTAAVGQIPYPDVAEVLRVIGRAVRRLIAFDAHDEALAAGDGRAANLVLLGALAGSGALPFDAAHLETAIADLAGGRPAPARAFAAGLARGRATP